MPFKTAEETGVETRKARPTAMSSAEIRKAWSPKIREEALFGARITLRAYLDTLKKRLAEVAGGAITPQEAEAKLRETLRDLGYSPERGFGDGKTPAAKPMTIQDLSSSHRIRLIIDTNVKRARSMGQVAASENPVVLLANPAWKLTRTGARKKPRGDWRKRWEAAGAKCGWNGASKRQMVALKSSPIWQALADGAGGYTDTLGSPFPPFAFGSGLSWVNVGSEEWRRICRAEGIPDGMDDVLERAKQLKRERDGLDVKPESRVVEVDVDVPDMGDRPKGVDNPLVREVDATATRTRRPAIPYTPDWNMRDEANNAVDDALDAIGAVEETLAEWTREISAMPDGGTGRLASYSDRISQIAAEVASLKGRVVNYGGSIGTQPAPRSLAEQTAYDSAMERYARAATATARRVERMLDSARLWRMAADRAVRA